MALIRCPECKREISDQAASCPECGYPLPGRNAIFPGPFPFGARTMEYKSKRTLFGLPLIHIVYGPAWMNGFRPAKGIIAIGNIAVGVIAIGGFAAGIITLAGIGFGLFCFAGIALGIGVGIGGIATGYLAVGGVAIGVYAVGGMAIGSHTLLGDPQFRESLRKIFRF